MDAMAGYQEYLAILDSDPRNDQALLGLKALDGTLLTTPDATRALDEVRTALRDRGEIEVVAELFDIEYSAAETDSRRADLLLAKGHLYADDFLNEQDAAACFHKVLEIRPDDEDAQEVLANMDLVRQNWQKIVAKYLDEAKVSTDRQLTTSLLLSAAETFARYESGASQVEQHLREALEVEPRNRRAATHLERLLRKESRWQELAGLFEQRVDAAAGKQERVQALLNLADLARTELASPAVAVDAMKKVIAADPANPRALRTLADQYESEENWSALVMLYTNALKARRRSIGRDSEVGMLLQIAMLHWRRLDNSDAAEEYFRRIRKSEPAHPAALDFYREYYPSRGEGAKLLQALRQAHKAIPDESVKRALSVEIAHLAEGQLGNPEKAIDSWKGILRAEPANEEARDALKRLYRKTEKWNALLDLMKDEIERLPAEDIQGRIERLLVIVEIYRDRLRLDVMVINTYNTVLQLDPNNESALDALAAKYESLGRWNDLIAVLSRKAELANTSDAGKVAMFRQIASLWSDRFGNYAQAVKPLEALLEVAPGDKDAIGRLKEIYTKRRQWRALIALMGREVEQLPSGERRQFLVDMAQLASDRLGDPNLSIDIWNRVLELHAERADGEALGALASLYERDKRWMALAEVCLRHRDLLGDSEPRAAAAVLERLGQLYADRLGATELAAHAYRDLLRIDPTHGRALRSLRELYAASGDVDAQVALYSELGQYDELVEVLSAMADRLSEPRAQLALLERTAAIASEHLQQSPEKVVRAHERIQSVEPKHPAAAQALVPLYTRTEKWARLLATYEVLLEHATEQDDRLNLHVDIRDLCEVRLGSKALAFQWTCRAYELQPDNERLLEDIMRLGAEADAWDEVAQTLDRRAKVDSVDPAEKLRLYRELGAIAASRLHKPDEARRYHEAVLELAPDDPAAMDALEKLASEQSRWPDLLKIFRRRAELSDDRVARLELLFKIAFIQEERVGDLDAAAETYKEILGLDAGSARAMTSLRKVQEERGDSGGLAAALERELGVATEADTRVGLLLRLGGLYEDKLGRRSDALVGYQEALGLAPKKREIHDSLARFLEPVDDQDRSHVQVAQLLLPVYESSGDGGKIARCVEILRAATDDPLERLEHDRRLVKLYGADPERQIDAFEASVRVLHAAPEDAGNRKELLEYSAELDGFEEYAGHLAKLVTERTLELDPDTRLALWQEVAYLFDERLQQSDRAEAAWRRVLELDAGNVSAYEAIDRLYRGAERWQDLRDLLSRREQNCLEPEQRKEILLSICDLDEGVLDNVAGAIGTYRRVLDLDPGMVRAYKALERLYVAREAWQELEELLGNELDHLPEGPGQEASRAELTYRRASLRASRLDDAAGAVDLLEEIVAAKPGYTDARELLEELLSAPEQRLRVAKLLEPLYEADGLWRDLCIVLRAQREFAAGPPESVDLLVRVATVEEEQISSERAAFDTYLEALKLDPSDERPRKALLRLASLTERWTDAAISWEDGLAEVADHDVSLRAEMLAELAEMYDRHLADVGSAITAYRRLLEVDPGNPELCGTAARALDRLYSEEGQWAQLIEIVRKQSDWSDSPQDRRNCLARVAQLHEQQLGDVESAISAWRDVLGEDPEDSEALDALERLFGAGGHARELVDILRRRVEIANDSEDKKVHLQRIASLYELDIQEPSEAILAHLEVLDHLPDDDGTLCELARLYRAGERWIDLLDIDERRLGRADAEAERVALGFEIGELLATHLDRHSEGVERFARVLADDPSHVGALTALEGLADEQSLRSRVAQVLRPHYERSGENDKLAALLCRLADVVDDPRERVACMRSVAELREHKLDDRDGAFNALDRAVHDALAEPELPELIAELERLAAALHREQDLIEVYRDVAPEVLDGDLQRRLYLDIADLSRAVLRDVAVAREYYQRVIDAQPDDPRAMAALESIYRDAEEHERLYEILTRKAELNEDNLEVRSAALAEAARLCGEPLGRPDDAVMHWEQVLEVTPDNSPAYKALEELYEAGERWHELAELLERRVGFAYTTRDAVELQVRLGGIFVKQLSDPERAVDAYAAALGGDANNEQATSALELFLDEAGIRTTAADVLEPVYVARQEWHKLVKIYEIKLDAAEDSEQRIRLTRYIARLYEEQLEDLDEAFRWYGRVFKEDPRNLAVCDQLNRLAIILQDWKGLTDVYQEFVDDEPGDGPELQAIALALADTYDRRMNEVDRAMAAYRRVLQSNPEDAQTFGRLEAMLTRAERWYALVEAYEQGVADTLDDGQRIDLYARIARVQEQNLKDLERAVESYRSILDIDPGNTEASHELDRLYQAGGQWFELTELLQTRLERATEPAVVAALRLRLAGIAEERLDDMPSAIEHYEQVLAGEYEREAALAALERLVVHEDHQERIASILEPVYRAADWWQKLVVILDAQLKFVDDSDRRVAMLREIAQLHESRGGDEQLALEALARAWKEEISCQDVYDALSASAAKLGAWEQLVETLEQGIEGNYEYDLVAQVLARIAELQETRCGRGDRAIDAWRRLLDVREDDAVALESLDRLLGASSQHVDQAAIVSRRAELAEDEASRREFLYRLAQLQEQELGLVDEAIQSWRGALAADDSDSRALDALERLYREVSDFAELGMVLGRKIELAADPAQRRALRFVAAAVHDENQNDPFEAIAQLRAVLDDDPDDAVALERLDGLYLRETMWHELLEIIDRRAQLAPDGGRAELQFRAATLVDKELLEPEDAIERYSRVLEREPLHAGARVALDALAGREETLAAAASVLERVYRSEQAYGKVAELYERRISAAEHGDPQERLALFRQLAELHELDAADHVAAFAVWARALACAPEVDHVQDQLERLAATRGAWDELISLYVERLDDLVDPELEYTYSTKIARLCEDALGNNERAAEYYLRAQAVANDATEALAALDRIYEREQKWADLAEILGQEADATFDEQAQSEFLYRLGDVRERHLADASGAVTAYREVLDRQPQHQAARAALERLLSSDAERSEIISILEPLYEMDGEWGRLVELLGAKLGTTLDNLDRAALYQRIAELAEANLSDPVRALDAAGGWLAEDPSSPEALAEVERLAEAVQRWGEVAARLSGIVESTDSDEVRQQLSVRLGQVQLDKLVDSVAAEQTFSKVLASDAENAEALAALERIYRERQAVPQLAEILARRGQLLFDVDDKRRCFVEVARLREQLKDVAGAVAAWREVVELDEGDCEAHVALAAHYEASTDWSALIDVLGLSARFATDTATEKAARVRIAMVHSGPLHDLEAAVDAWLAVIDLDPEDLEALGSLESVHAEREDWLAVQEVLVRRLSAVATNAERVEIYRKLAGISETRRESVDEAISYLHQVLDLDNADMGAYGELERLLAGAERWHDLVEVLQRVADVVGTLGDSAKEVGYLARAADVWEGPLENSDAAGEILEKILQRDPNYVPAFNRLARIYEAQQEWDRCSEVLQRALALGPTGADAAELYYRLGEVARRNNGDDEAAANYFAQALQFEYSHVPSATAVEQIARGREDWGVVADMLARRESVAVDPATKLELTLEMADIYRKKLGQPEEVIPMLEQAARLAPDDARVLGPLGDIYFAAQRYAEALPIYERLAQEAKSKRRMKDVGRYRQRAGSIAEATGQVDVALAAYEEAFRVNPTDVETMAGLGRLYLSAQDWEKARRIYRSMVLQNINPEFGITKAGVYLNLGNIHVQLGEVQKAKGMYQRGLELEPDNAQLQSALAAASQ